jgi:hypothetical protein
MSAFGRNAAWLRNIEATPSPEVVIGSQHFVAALHRTDHPRGIEPPPRLAIRWLNERSPAARRATTAYRVPYAASSDVITLLDAANMRPTQFWDFLGSHKGAG